jgi:Bacterial Ig domain
VTAAYGADVDHTASSSGPMQVTFESPPAEEPPAEEPPAEEPPAEEPPADTTAPVIEIASPSDGGTFVRGGTVDLTATASDAVGVTRVVFEVNGAVKCTLTGPRWTCQWTAPKGKTTTYTIVATAFDAAGNSSSHRISVTTVKG